ncbi:hypothetical protein VTN96DRAFT_9603 [Rasamsonia emersonii]|uniref:50S ribosomal protein L36 n=1 Tax=Rasamsonia emersonii (strain ATCC 16479 / CBS 393.64 / IMI 116815) TaxID=1408163 RepID=A0A0F4YSX7_RASE3|nr:50S ribosomal protein L36 [Rasamsonia emersonii CBS 393.64]KKA21392.1 50S ribosomal protein L36 [Rasamsonia emersonii CBS 393.64]
MSVNLPLRRASTGAATALPSTTFICNQCRHATLLRRPKRPYTFTQLVTLSDGSTFIHRTTSPAPVYRSTRDTRNSLLWNPSSVKLMTVEEDEAGRLAAFRARFGRSWDAANTSSEEASKFEKSETSASASSSSSQPVDQKKTGETQADQEAAAAEAAAVAQAEAELQEEEDNLLDLISSFGQAQEEQQSGKKK